MRTLGAFLGLSIFFVGRAALATPFTVYDDALSSSFSDKSIAANPNYAFTTNPYQGNDCISVQLFQQGYMAVASGGTPDISQYGGVDFYHRTSAGSMTLVVQLRSSTQPVGNSVSVSVTSTWTNAHLTLADFGLNQNSGTIVGIQFSSTTLNIPAIALDDITLFDATISDAGPDASLSDGGFIDAGSSDGGTSDGGSIDASTTDAGVDASTNDSGASDGGSIDASPTPDASVDASPKPDASQKESGVDEAGSDVDAGGEPNDGTSGCSCDLATTSGYTSAIPLALVALALIARRRRS